MKNLREYFITTSRPYTEGAVEVFEQEVTAKNVKKATLTITALGVYEAQINGQKVGDMLFAPGYTYYPKEVQVQEYDVTAMLQSKNVLRVYLGQGWYAGRFTFENKVQIYGEKPAVSWVLVVEDENGTATYHSKNGVIGVKSPYVYGGMYDGEVLDDTADREVFQPVPFEGVLPEHFDETILCVKVQEEVTVKEVIHHKGYTILDFGQNFGGSWKSTSIK